MAAPDSSPSEIDQMDENGGEEQEQEQAQELELHMHVLALDDSVIDRKLLEDQMDENGGEEQEQEQAQELELHVLAVDDSVIDRKLLETLLKKSSCKVTTAENGQMALEYLGLAGLDDNHGSALTTTGVKVNLIITDYSMPGMTGYELLKKIKESSTMKEIPVVIVSSDNIPTRINKCLEEGAQEFILKPLQQSDVKNLRCQMMMKINKSCSGRLFTFQ